MNHISVHFFLNRPCLFHLSTEEVLAYSVKNGHQSADYPDDTLNISINRKRSSDFPSSDVVKKFLKIKRNKTQKLLERSWLHV